jgi:cytochrome oxidase Cu insertion factor (SCO1/SenC/PrrC family)
MSHPGLTLARREDGKRIFF